MSQLSNGPSSFVDLTNHLQSVHPESQFTLTASTLNKPLFAGFVRNDAFEPIVGSIPFIRSQLQLTAEEVYELDTRELCEGFGLSDEHQAWQQGLTVLTDYCLAFLFLHEEVFNITHTQIKRNLDIPPPDLFRRLYNEAMSRRLESHGFSRDVSLYARNDKIHGLSANDPVTDFELSRVGEYSIREVIALGAQFDISIDDVAAPFTSAINSVLYELSLRNHWLEKGEEKFSLRGRDLVTMSRHYNQERLSAVLEPWLNERRIAKGTGAYLRMQEYFMLGNSRGRLFIGDNYVDFTLKDEHDFLRLKYQPEASRQEKCLIEVLFVAKLTDNSNRYEWCFRLTDDYRCIDFFNDVELSSTRFAAELRRLEGVFREAVSQREQSPCKLMVAGLGQLARELITVAQNSEPF